MPLQIINDCAGKGVYIGKLHYAASPELLICADSFSSAWELMCEFYAGTGELSPVADDEFLKFDHNDSIDPLPPEGSDWVDGSDHGWYHTGDLMLTPVRHSEDD